MRSHLCIALVLTLTQSLQAEEQVLGEERQIILAQILAQQAHLEQVSAAFDVTVEFDPAQIQKEKPCWAAPILYRLPTQTVRGAIEWHRDATNRRERVDIRFDVPPELALDYFMDRILVDDGERQVEGYLSTRQLLVTWTRPLATWPVPSDFLYPYGRANLQAVAASWSSVKVLRGERGQLVVRFSPKSSPETIIEAVVAPEWDYAVTSWRTGKSARPTVSLEYTRDEAGRAVPRRAKFERTLAPESELVLMRWTLEATRFDVGRPAESVFRFPFVDGMIGADYSKSKSDKDAKLFHTDADGDFVEIPRTAQITRPTGAGATYASVGAAVIVLAVLGFRFACLIDRVR